MKKMLNTVHIEGYVYQLGEANGRNMLEKKVTGERSKNPGTEYIGGTIQIAVDEDGLNVIPVHFSYVTATTSKGSANATFNALSKIINGPTWVANGKEQAVKVKIDTALALNDFYVEENGEDKLVSSKIHEGGFVEIVSTLDPELEKRNTFKVDMLITAMNNIEANPEKNIPEDYATLRGAIFNFRNEILPMEFNLRNPKGILFFESLNIDPTNPAFITVWGAINCQTIVTTQVEESAFGAAAVRTFEKKNREWLVCGSKPEVMDFGDEAVLTENEVKEALANRQVKLAEAKKQRDEYKANKTPAATATVATPAAPKAKTGGFVF